MMDEEELAASALGLCSLVLGGWWQVQALAPDSSHHLTAS